VTRNGTRVEVSCVGVRTGNKKVTALTPSKNAIGTRARESHYGNDRCFIALGTGLAYRLKRGAFLWKRKRGYFFRLDREKSGEGW